MLGCYFLLYPFSNKCIIVHWSLYIIINDIENVINYYIPFIKSGHVLLAYIDIPISSNNNAVIHILYRSTYSYRHEQDNVQIIYLNYKFLFCTPLQFTFSRLLFSVFLFGLLTGKDAVS